MAGSQGSGRLGSDDQRGDSSVALGKCGSSLLDKGSKGDCPVCGCHGGTVSEHKGALEEGQGAHWAFHDSEVGRGKFGSHWEGAV